MRHYGKTEPMIVEGVADGSFWAADLFNYASEDGTTHEFHAEMLSEQEAKDLVAFWSTGGAPMVRAAAKCVDPMIEEALRTANLGNDCGDERDPLDRSDAGLPPFNHNLIR